MRDRWKRSAMKVSADVHLGLLPLVELLHLGNAWTRIAVHESAAPALHSLLPIFGPVRQCVIDAANFAANVFPRGGGG